MNTPSAPTTAAGANSTPDVATLAPPTSAPSAARSWFKGQLPDLYIAVAVALLSSYLRLFTMNYLASHKDLLLRDLAVRFDAGHYIAIAQHGYVSDASLRFTGERLAFFPLFPALLRVFHEITRLDYDLAGMLLNVLLSIGMVFVVSKIAQHLGANQLGKIAAGTVVMLSPFSFAFDMVYTETLFGLLSCAGIYFMLRQRWEMVGLVGFLLGLTRVTSTVFFILLFIVVVVQARKSLAAWAAALLAPAGFIGYLLFVKTQPSEYGGYFELQRNGWNSAFDFGKATTDFLKFSFIHSNDGWIVITSIFVLFLTLSCLLLFKREYWIIWMWSTGIAASVILSNGFWSSRPRLLIPAMLLFVPVVISWTARMELTKASYAKVIGWCAGLTALGAATSAHLLLTATWAV